jgi:hypothetical protein
MANAKYKSLPEKSPGADSGSTTNDILDGILWGGVCIGYRKLAVTDAAPVGFADIADPDAGGPLVAGIPAGSKYAMCVLEADALEADSARVVRYRTDASNPTAAEGMPVGDNGSFEVKGTDNLANFKIIGMVAGHSHILRIEFYGEG